MKEVKINFIYNIIYQILVLILPLITVPYVSRVIGADGIGQYSYTYSIMYYFMIFAMLGLNNYGNRTIAKNRDNIEIMSKKFKEIYLLQFITSATMIMIYALYVTFFCTEYKVLAYIQIIYLFSCLFDINWFFFGIEKFKITVTRNLIIKLISLILIFMFVKSSDDIWIYTLILSGATLVSQLLLWPFVHKYIINIKIELSDVIKHFIPCLKLFLPVIAVTIYKVMDKTMIGSFTNVSEVGYYESAEKIINVPIAIISALGTVMLPRMSNIYSKNNNEKGKEVIEKSINLMMFLSFAMVAGIIAISKDFTLIFFGESFIKTGTIIIYLSITLIFLSWGNVIRTQYLIPKEKDKEYIISAFLGALVNFILNIILIPKYKAIGACYGTIAAEFIVMFYQTNTIKKELPIKKFIKNIIPFFIKALIMLIIVIQIRNIEISIYLKILLQIFVGCLVYFVLNIKYILNLLNVKKEK